MKMPEGPLMVDQTKARHILIKTSAVMSDDQARQRLESARQRIVNGGESFEAVARAVSDDASAPMGGELGWINPGETVPPFENAMNQLAVGQLSEPVQTEFGWHLIEVQERRTQDMAEQYRRNLAREELFLRRAASSFEAWLQQVRNQTYIDNRMFRPEGQ
jgi:peptidyl-prolyl cis-trans isomerase SurA